MSFAVIETGGKQYVVEKGDVLDIEKIAVPEKGAISFDKVLLIDDGKSATMGAPYVAGATVAAKLIEQGRGDKITVLKFKNKIRYHVKRGHRQYFTRVEIVDVKTKK